MEHGMLFDTYAMLLVSSCSIDEGHSYEYHACGEQSDFPDSRPFSGQPRQLAWREALVRSN